MSEWGSKRLYIDWSGDPGMRLNRGSSRLLTIAVAAVYDPPAFVDGLANLRHELRVHEKFEFHWAKIPIGHRNAYLQCIARQAISGWALVVEKETINDKVQALEPHVFLCSCIARLFWNIPETVISGGELVIDDANPRSELVRRIRSAVSECMKARGLKKRLKGARGSPAYRDDGLQLADMVAGAVQAMFVDEGASYIIPEKKIDVYRA